MSGKFLTIGTTEKIVSTCAFIVFFATFFVLYNLVGENEISARDYQTIINSPQNSCKERFIKNKEYVSENLFNDFKECERNIREKEQEERLVRLRKLVTK